MQMTFEEIKAQAKKTMVNNLVGEDGQLSSLKNEFIEYAQAVIDRWDVRAVHMLIDLFPGCVPNINTISYHYDDASGQWIIGLK